MTTIYDVPAKELIDSVAKKLRNEKEVTTPDWGKFVRTGVHKENSPEGKDWWYIRCASILRKIYMKNIIGVERLCDEYGGKQNRGSKPHKAKSGSGSIARAAMQQLESAGLVRKIKGKGRTLSSKGRSLLDNSSHEVKQNLIGYIPELKKY